MGFERYKIIVQSVVGEMRGQSVRVASRSLWDDKSDNFASEELRTPNIYGCVMVYGLYFE